MWHIEVNPQRGQEGMDVQMRFFVNEVWGDWINAEDMGDGFYEVGIESACSEWLIKYIDSNYEPEEPNTNPCEGTVGGFHLFWQIGNWD